MFTSPLGMDREGKGGENCDGSPVKRKRICYRITVA